MSMSSTGNYSIYEEVQHSSIFGGSASFSKGADLSVSKTSPITGTGVEGPTCNHERAKELTLYPVGETWEHRTRGRPLTCVEDWGRATTRWDSTRLPPPMLPDPPQLQSDELTWSPDTMSAGQTKCFCYSLCDVLCDLELVHFQNGNPFLSHIQYNSSFTRISITGRRTT